MSIFAPTWFLVMDLCTRMSLTAEIQQIISDDSVRVYVNRTLTFIVVTGNTSSTKIILQILADLTVFVPGFPGTAFGTALITHWFLPQLRQRRGDVLG